MGHRADPRLNELKGIWAADLLVVQTVSYRTLYVFLFIAHDRRELGAFQRHRESNLGVDLAPDD